MAKVPVAVESNPVAPDIVDNELLIPSVSPEIATYCVCKVPVAIFKVSVTWFKYPVAASK